MDEERRRVLDLLDAGRITADQAVELIRALQPASEPARGSANGLAPGTRLIPPPVAPALPAVPSAVAPLWRARGARITFGSGTPAAQDRTWERRSARWLRLRVLDGQGRSKVDVQLPLGVLGLALRMGSRWLPQLGGLDPDFILAAAQLRPGRTLFEVVDDEDGDRLELSLE